MRFPRGYTLIETLAVITIGAALAGFAVVLLQALLRGQSAAKDAQQRVVIFRRLSDDFRRDVHAAREAEPDASGLRLRGFSPGCGARSVRYEVQASEILRVEEREDGAGRRESYFLPESFSASFRRETAGPLRLIVLTPQPPEESSLAPLFSTSVEAVLGKDHRFEKETEEEQP